MSALSYCFHLWHHYDVIQQFYEIVSTEICESAARPLAPKFFWCMWNTAKISIKFGGDKKYVCPMYMKHPSKYKQIILYLQSLEEL